jgi:hypothetical protein
MALCGVKPVEDKVLSLAEEIAAAELEQTPDDVVLSQSGPAALQSNTDDGETPTEAVLGTLTPPMKASSNTTAAEAPMAEPPGADIPHLDTAKEYDDSNSAAVTPTTLVSPYRRTTTGIVDQKGHADDVVKHLCRQCRAR